MTNGIGHDMMYMYHNFFIECIEKFEIRYPEHMHTRYPVKALNSFIAFGLWGFIHSSPGSVTDEIGDQARKLIKDLISSDIFS